ncbi:MAG: cell division protein ZapA [Clostridia bacterium]|nr:cell division protein ZapA [Clostridia bacterium]
MDKSTVAVNIAGVDLVLISENSEQYVQKLADELTSRINKIKFSTPVGITSVQASMVCALDLLDENYRLKVMIEELKK